MERRDVWFSSAGNDPDPEFETRRCFDSRRKCFTKTAEYHDPERIYYEETVLGTAVSYSLTSNGMAHYPVDMKFARWE